MSLLNNEETAINFPSASMVNALAMKLHINIDLQKIENEEVKIRSSLQFSEEFQKRSVTERWQQVFATNQAEDCTEIYKFMSHILSLPISSASSERVFSVMNIKARPERNKISNELLKNELLISINFNIPCSQFYDLIKHDQDFLAAVRSATKYRHVLRRKAEELAAIINNSCEN